jgi:general stress protein 26
MKKLFVLIIVIAALMINPTTVLTEINKGEKGGPKFLYTKAKKKPLQHPMYDESIKCVECHKYNGVDAYTSATLTMKKSNVGVLPRGKLEKRIAEIVKGKGNHREIYVLSTSYENKPLATVIEFVLDPKTMTFYSFSERQTEKLFHVASNQHVSLAYVKQLDHHNYFKETLGIQVVGKAKLLKETDPEIDEAMRIYIPTLESMVSQKFSPERIQKIRKTQIITMVTPDRIVVRDYTNRLKGNRLIQIWEREGNFNVD